MTIYETIDGDEYSIMEDWHDTRLVIVRRCSPNRAQFVGYLWRAGQAEYRVQSDTSAPVAGIRNAVRCLVVAMGV